LTVSGTPDKLFRPRFRIAPTRPLRPVRARLDFSKHIQKAEEALKRRNYDFAVELFRQLIDLDPDQGDARSGLRRALHGRHRQKKGGKFLRAVSGALPLTKARALFKLGRHAACARALEDYLATNPVDEGANLMLGISLEEGGHYRSARAVYEFAAEIAPKNCEALKRAGSMLHRTGDHDRALEYYERALQADPRDQEALKARKNLAAETALTRTGAAGAEHSRDLIKNKEEARILERSQKLHVSKEDLEKDLERLEARHAENPSDPDLLLEISEIHERLKDPAAALEYAQRALSYRKDSAELVAKIGDLESKRIRKELAQADKEGRVDDANKHEEELVQHEVADYRRRVVARPGDSVLRLALSKKLIRAGAIDEALAELQRCSGEARVRNEALFFLGQCFHKKGILDLAHKEYESALQVAEEKSERAKEILYSLGTIAEAQGNSEGARSFYIRIYEIDIGYRDVAEKMGTLSS